jgi:hypothetical protein
MLAAVLTMSTGHAFAGVDDDVKATFDRFVAAQNAHDVSAVRDLLLDSPNFLWVTRGAPIWGREAALKRFGDRAIHRSTPMLSAARYLRDDQMNRRNAIPAQRVPSLGTAHAWLPDAGKEIR